MKNKVHIIGEPAFREHEEHRLISVNMLYGLKSSWLSCWPEQSPTFFEKLVSCYLIDPKGRHANVISHCCYLVNTLWVPLILLTFSADTCLIKDTMMNGVIYHSLAKVTFNASSSCDLGSNSSGEGKCNVVWSTMVGKLSQRYWTITITVSIEHAALKTDICYGENDCFGCKTLGWYACPGLVTTAYLSQHPCRISSKRPKESSLYALRPHWKNQEKRLKLGGATVRGILPPKAAFWILDWSCLGPRVHTTKTPHWRPSAPHKF